MRRRNVTIATRRYATTFCVSYVWRHRRTWRYTVCRPSRSCSRSSTRCASRGARRVKGHMQMTVAAAPRPRDRRTAARKLTTTTTTFEPPPSKYCCFLPHVIATQSPIYYLLTAISPLINAIQIHILLYNQIKGHGSAWSFYDCHHNINEKKPVLTRVQWPTPALFLCIVISTFDLSQVDSAFYPPWDGKMSTSQRCSAAGE